MGKLVGKETDGVYTIWEAKALVAEIGLKAAAEKIKVITTGTFEPIEAVGLFFEIHQPSPKIKFGKLLLNDVEAYPYGKEGGGILNASVESYGEGKSRSGAHVIEELVQRKKIRVKGTGQLKDRYGRRELEDLVDIKSLKNAKLEIIISGELTAKGAINSSEKSIISDLGALLPDCGNINYTGCGEISPFAYGGLLRNLQIGAPVFIGGAVGDISDKGVESGTELTIRGDLREMDGRFLRAGGFGKSGSALYIGVGVPFEVKNVCELEQILAGEETKRVEIFDIGNPTNGEKPCGQYSYQELSQGHVLFNGKETRTASTASVLKGKEVAFELKERIERGEFPICQKQE